MQWHLPENETFVSENLPHPCVHLVYESQNTALYGPIKGHFKKQLSGQGCAIGCRFKPGLFYPWIQQPVSKIAGQQLDASTILPINSNELEAQLHQAPGIEESVAVFTNILNKRLPHIGNNSEPACLANRIVMAMEDHPELQRVEQVCACFHMNGRQLERLFYKYVGLTPKWVLRIYRLQQLANEIVNGRNIDWSDLALRLGYFDQAHCIRDFKQITGKTPSSYQ